MCCRGQPDDDRPRGAAVIFGYRKSSGEVELIDTATSDNRWAARYLAKNWETVCKLDLSMLSDAYLWLMAFRNPHAQLEEGRDALGTYLRRTAALRFRDAFPVAP